MHKKLYVLRNTANLLKEEKSKLVGKYRDFYLEPEALSALKEQESLSIDEFVCNSEIILSSPNNTYKIKEDNKEFFISVDSETKVMLPFEITSNFGFPKKGTDEHRKLAEKYTKFVPFTKSEILNFVYEDAKKVNPKITKKFFSTSTITKIRDEMKSLNVSTLEDFLLFYNIKKDTILRVKKIEKESKEALLSKERFYIDALKICNSSDRASKKIYDISKYTKDIEAEIEKVESMIFSQGLYQNAYITIGEQESFEAIDGYGIDMLSKYFKKDIDKGRYSFAVKNGEQEHLYGEILSVKFISAAKNNIAELLYNINISEYVKSKYIQTQKFEKNDVIKFTP